MILCFGINIFKTRISVEWSNMIFCHLSSTVKILKFLLRPDALTENKSDTTQVTMTDFSITTKCLICNVKFLDNHKLILTLNYHLEY